MKGRALLLISIGVLLCLAGAGALAWLHAAPTYPRVVYHFTVSEVDISPQGVRSAPAPPYEEWIDPAGPYLSFGPRQRSKATVLRAGYQYGFGRHVPIDPRYWICHQELARSLRHGFAGQGAFYLARAVGPVVRTHLDGVPALRFNLEECFADAVETMWIDAATHAILQTQTTGTGATSTLFYRDQHAFARGSLPGGFFDPPPAHQSIWQRLQAWLGHYTRR